MIVIIRRKNEKSKSHAGPQEEGACTSRLVGRGDGELVVGSVVVAARVAADLDDGLVGQRQGGRDIVEHVDTVLLLALDPLVHP
jgi:hypothetical protein